MTDQDRAEQFVEQHATYLFMHHESDRTVVASNVVQLLAAVRLEERKTIAAWLRSSSGPPLTPKRECYRREELAERLNAADRIERGEHAGGRP